MSTAEPQSKFARYGWLALLGLCLLPCLTSTIGRLDPKAVLAPIPLGTQLSKLDGYLGKFYESSSVEEWVAVRTRDSTGHRKTKYGSFFVRELGEYDVWTASEANRDAFTGEILFFHYSRVIPDDLAPSYVFSLIYVHGVLKEKDYGHLPG